MRRSGPDPRADELPPRDVGRVRDAARAGASPRRRSRSRYAGKSIAEVLELTVEEAATVFAPHPRRSRRPLAVLVEIGLGYLTLGQPSNTLSGGEAQRIKLASELGRSGQRPHALRARRADDRPPLRRRRPPDRRLPSPGRPGPHARDRRAQPRRAARGRPRDRPRPRGGGRRAARSSRAGRPEDLRGGSRTLVHGVLAVRSSDYAEPHASKCDTAIIDYCRRETFRGKFFLTVRPRQRYLFRR